MEDAQLLATSNVELPEPPQQPYVNGVAYKRAQEQHTQPGSGAGHVTARTPAAAGSAAGQAAKQPPATAEKAAARPSSQEQDHSAAAPSTLAKPSVSGRASSGASSSSGQPTVAKAATSSSSSRGRPPAVTRSVDGEQAYWDPPKRLATVGGVYEGSVDATVDEQDAAVKWANVKEDPEYVI